MLLNVDLIREKTAYYLKYAKKCSQVQYDADFTEYLLITATWSTWSAWSDCTISCGRGRREQSRTCSKQGLCRGDDRRYQVCNDFPCPGKIVK